jgi:hypothetical protein
LIVDRAGIPSRAASGTAAGAGTGAGGSPRGSAELVPHARNSAGAAALRVMISSATPNAAANHPHRSHLHIMSRCHVPGVVAGGMSGAGGGRRSRQHCGGSWLLPCDRGAPAAARIRRRAAASSLHAEA